MKQLIIKTSQKNQRFKLLIWGLSKWLNSRSEIEKIKLELETLK